MPKKKTISKLLDENAILLQKIVRIKAADSEGYCECVSCGNRYSWKSMDGGHFISRKYQATKDCEENIHPQCKRCNGWPDNFTYQRYRQYMVATYGKKFTEDLERLAHKPKKRYRQDLLDENDELKARLKELESVT